MKDFLSLLTDAVAGIISSFFVVAGFVLACLGLALAPYLFTAWIFHDFNIFRWEATARLVFVVLFYATRRIQVAEK